MALWEDPFQKLSEDLKATFRPQREWVSRRGALLILAHFFSGAGAGTWLFSWLFDFRLGLWLGLGLVAVGGGVPHLLFLGRMDRFWRIISRPLSSWISRGLIAMALFLLSGLLYLVNGGNAWLALSLVGTGGLFLYKGFVYAASRAIPFWNTPLLPILYMAYALRGGAAVLLVAAALGAGGLELEPLELIKLWVVISTAVLVLIYLVGMTNAGVAARRSVAELVAGRVSLSFYLGVVLLGLAIPILVGAFAYFNSVSLGVLGAVGLASLVGDFYVKYCVARAGIYLPVVGEFPAR